MKQPFQTAVLLVLALLGCAGTQKASVQPDLSPPPPPPPAQKQEVRFAPVFITGDPELERLNESELFAAGTAAYASEDFKNAARYFGRIADFFPESSYRRQALYNAGLAHEKLNQWEEALPRFGELSEPDKGTGDALDAAFRYSEVLYHLDRYDDAAKVLATLGARRDLGMDKRLEAQVQQGICELEAGHPEAAEATLRKAVAAWQALKDPDEVDDYFPAQGQFFLGEIYRLYSEAVRLDPDATADKLGKDLDYKCELLLSAQGHYLRAMRVGNGYWATAAGERVGGLYENLYAQMVDAPAPRELNTEEATVYQAELRKKLRVLITKAISVYERTLEAAERIGARSHFIDRTRDSLQKMRDELLAQTRRDEEEARSAAAAAAAERDRAQGKKPADKKDGAKPGKKAPRS